MSLKRTWFERLPYWQIILLASNSPTLSPKYKISTDHPPAPNDSQTPKLFGRFEAKINEKHCSCEFFEATHHKSEYKWTSLEKIKIAFSLFLPGPPPKMKYGGVTVTHSKIPNSDFLSLHHGRLVVIHRKKEERTMWWSDRSCSAHDSKYAMLHYKCCLGAKHCGHIHDGGLCSPFWTTFLTNRPCTVCVLQLF